MKPKNYNALIFSWDKLNKEELPKNYEQNSEVKWVHNGLEFNPEVTHSKENSTDLSDFIGDSIKEIELRMDNVKNLIAMIIKFKNRKLTITNNDEIFISNQPHQLK